MFKSDIKKAQITEPGTPTVSDPSSYAQHYVRMFNFMTSRSLAANQEHRKQGSSHPNRFSFLFWGKMANALPLVWSPD